MECFSIQLSISKVQHTSKVIHEIGSSWSISVLLIIFRLKLSSSNSNVKMAPGRVHVPTIRWWSIPRVCCLIAACLVFVISSRVEFVWRRFWHFRMRCREIPKGMYCNSQIEIWEWYTISDLSRISAGRRVHSRNKKGCFTAKLIVDVGFWRQHRKCAYPLREDYLELNLTVGFTTVLFFPFALARTHDVLSLQARSIVSTITGTPNFLKSREKLCRPTGTVIRLTSELNLIWPFISTPIHSTHFARPMSYCSLSFASSEAQRTEHFSMFTFLSVFYPATVIISQRVLTWICVWIGRLSQSHQDVREESLDKMPVKNCAVPAGAASCAK